MKRLKTIYTDGGCYKGIGSWAYVILDGVPESDKHELEHKLTGITLGTTNNRMEMIAIIEAISMYDDTTHLIVCSDSGYVVTGFTHPSYLKKWVRNGWRTSKNDQVENQDLWKELIKLNESRNIEFIHIRGHGKNNNHIHNYFNNIVDRMCTEVRNNYNECIRRELVKNTD